MSELPDSWTMGTIADLVDVGPKNQCDDSTLVGFVPMNRMGKTFRDIPTFEARRWGEVKKGYTHFADGDVLVARITPCFENGKAGIARGLPNGMGAGSTEYVVLRPKTGIATAQYVLARLKSDDFLSRGAHAMTGAVGQQRVPKAVIESFPVPIAPFPEQQRISLKLTALLADVDACRERLDRVPQILKKFREAILEAAVSGRLTEEWRGAHGVDLADWQQTSFEAASEYITVGHVGKMASEYVESGIPFLRSLNVRPFRFDRENLQHVSETFHKSLPKSALNPGDVVVVRTGAPGQCCVIPIDLPRANCSDLVILRPSELLNPHFACIYINSAVSQGFVRSEQVGVAQLHFNVGSMKKTPLRLPSLEEQAEIVRRQSELFSLADSLQRRCDNTLMRVEKLTPSVLAKAFRGELVPQDPNDEPAGVMLQRVRTAGSTNGAPATKIRAAGGRRR